jgi:hypothetical protein
LLFKSTLPCNKKAMHALFAQFGWPVGRSITSIGIT